MSSTSCSTRTYGFKTWSRLERISSRISEESAQTLACSIVMSRLDYSNSLLYGSHKVVNWSSLWWHARICAQQTSECAKYTGTSGHQIRCMDFSSTSSSDTPLVADLRTNWQRWLSESELLPHHNTCRVYFPFQEVPATRFGQPIAHCWPCREQEHQLQDGVSLVQDL